jgi:hypothetical protein
MNRKWLPAAVLAGAWCLFGWTGQAPAWDWHFFHKSACCDKVCQPTVEVKKVPKRCYGELCEDFCLPKCSFWHGCCFWHKSCCQDGCCAECEHPRTKKYLLVKIRTCEECVNRCVVQPACCPPPCTPPGPTVYQAPTGVQQAPVAPRQPNSPPNSPMPGK